MAIKKILEKNNMLVSFNFMTISIYALRVGKNSKEWRVAYGLITSSPDKMSKPIVLGSNQIGSCVFGNKSEKLSIRKIIWSGESDLVIGIYQDLVNGVSLKTSFQKWGVDTTDFDYDVSFTQESHYEEWGREPILNGQTSFTQSAQMIDPARLFEKDGRLPDDIEKALCPLEAYLKEQTRFPFGEQYDHVGNLEIVVALDRDAAGRPLVEYYWEKSSPFVQHVLIHRELIEVDDVLTANIVCKEDGRIVRDSIERIEIKAVNDLELKYDFEKCPDSIEIKIWRERMGESLVVSNMLRHFVKRISVTAGLIGGKMKITTEWLKEIRNVVPEKMRKKVDESMTIERSESLHSTIGEPEKRRVYRKKPQKCNDEFFPKGWDSKEEEHGLLSFLEWFKGKAKNAQSVFLQDPYFEDVAMYFLASANISSEYTVLTQTKLRTNSDGTNKEVEKGEDGLRKKKIVGGIKANPRMFAPMKLVVIDIPITHNVLHDRYLIFDYGEGKVEAYTLSNSLQGATNKVPLLITQIGDTAFEKVMKHIKETMSREGVQTIYNYAERLSEREDVEFDKVADGGFLKWLDCQKEIMKGGKVDHILRDIREWRTYDKLATLGYFLADMADEEAHGILSHLENEMRKDAYWVATLKDFILKGHYSNYPVGYINGPYRVMMHNDATVLMGLKYEQIVTCFNAHFLDYIGCEGHSYGVWGQFFAAKLLLRLSLTEYVDVLKQLRPTLLAIEADKTIEPCYKVSVMLMAELMEYDYWNKTDAVMVALMGEQDAWLRGIGALIFLHKAQDASFNCNSFRYLVSDDEVVTLSHAAWGMKPAPAHVDVFYDWLVDAFAKKGDADYFKKCLFEYILGESHCIEDKAGYVKHVALPLIAKGLVGKDELSKQMIEALFTKSIRGNETVKVKEVLPACLPVVDGDINLMYDLSKETVVGFKESVRKLPLKGDEVLFEVAKNCINLRVILMHLVQNYDSKSNSIIDAINGLLADLDKSLDEYGLGRSKRMFEY